MFSSGKFKLVIVMSALVACDLHGATRDDELLVDPTTPLILSAGTADTGDASGSDEGGFGFGFLGGLLTSYELSFVLIRGEDRIAVINDERVRVGDKIGSATVASIEADRVTLNVDGEIETLEVYENSIKTPTKGNGDD